MRRTLSLAASALLLLALAACRPRAPVAPTAAPELFGGTWGRFRTLTAEHRVTVEARSGEGAIEKRSLRGLLAVERPGRFRLRALGPGGITLFDLLYADGDVQVVESLRDPRSRTLSQLLAAIAGDLALAYDLRPRPETRAYRLESGTIIGSEPGRTVYLEDFRRVEGGVAPFRILIDSDRGYHVDIEAAQTVLDRPLDEALFRR